ncbi:MAG: hypothetical protein ACE5IG_00390 [Dehalococcoidia bacterium]
MPQVGQDRVLLQCKLQASPEPTITIPGVPGGGVRLEERILGTEMGNEVLRRGTPAAPACGHPKAPSGQSGC